MNRVFISLYFLIVFSVVIVGWGTDKLWQVYNPEPDTERFEDSFFVLMERQLRDLTVDEARLLSKTLSVDTNLEIEIYSIEELAKSELAAQIEQGEIVSIFDNKGRKSSYKRMGYSQIIARVSSDLKHKPRGNLYLILIIVFYLVIAIVIYFWIWPLSRDLRKLQNQTQRVGQDGVPAVVELGQRSAVYSLAEAFNKMVERIQDLLASHKEMTYAVSHELRTPLARMKFALEMALDSQSPAVIDKQLASVREDVADMDRLINELLAYAGFELQNHSLELQAGELPELAENLLKSNAAIFERDDKKVEYQFDNKMQQGTVYCAWYLMEVCLQNLTQNAFKYAHSAIKVTVEDKPGIHQFVIEDDGPGIDVEDAERVFSPFVRLHKDGVDNSKSGFGLGLSIVKRIVKWHGGRVYIGRSLMGGAKFIVQWPARAGMPLSSGQSV
ncbi:Sensor protein RstB [Thalassocella blandensis]|nr:Sensor protein RstB [Thalassocella blandensis]